MPWVRRGHQPRGLKGRERGGGSSPAELGRRRSQSVPLHEDEAGLGGRAKSRGSRGKAGKDARKGKAIPLETSDIDTDSVGPQW